MPRQTQEAPAKPGHYITVRVSEVEDAEISARAKAAGRTFSDYARYQLICGPIEQREREVLSPLAVTQLLRIGVNLNQLLDLPDAAGVHEAVGNLSDRIDPLVEEAIDTALGEEDYGGEDRSRMRRVRVTPDQQRVIKALADGSGKSLSDYAREMLTRGRVLIRRTRHREFPGYEELRDLGGLLNSRTRKGNTKGKTPHGLPPVLGRIHEILDAAAQG